MRRHLNTQRHPKQIVLRRHSKDMTTTVKYLMQVVLQYTQEQLTKCLWFSMYVHVYPYTQEKLFV